MFKNKQELKELIDKAFGTLKSTEEREKMIADLMDSIPQKGETSVYCQYIGTRISKIGIITRNDDGSICKRYYTTSEEYESLDW